MKLAIIDIRVQSLELGFNHKIEFTKSDGCCRRAVFPIVFVFSLSLIPHFPSKQIYVAGKLDGVFDVCIEKEGFFLNFIRFGTGASLNVYSIDEKYPV